MADRQLATCEQEIYSQQTTHNFTTPYACLSPMLFSAASRAVPTTIPRINPLANEAVNLVNSLIDRENSHTLATYGVRLLYECGCVPELRRNSQDSSFRQKAEALIMDIAQHNGTRKIHILSVGHGLLKQELIITAKLLAANIGVHWTLVDPDPVAKLNKQIQEGNAHRCLCCGGQKDYPQLSKANLFSSFGKVLQQLNSFYGAKATFESSSSLSEFYGKLMYLKENMPAIVLSIDVLPVTDRKFSRLYNEISMLRVGYNIHIYKDCHMVNFVVADQYGRHLQHYKSRQRDVCAAHVHGYKNYQPQKKLTPYC